MSGTPGVEWESAADCLIVGAGAVGLSLAFELAERERQVVVLERDRPGAGATGAAGGLLAPVFEAGGDVREVVELGRDSLERYPAFVARAERRGGVSCRHRREGALWAAFRPDELYEIETVAQALESAALGFERLDGEELRQLEPHLAEGAVGGLRVEDDHQVDPRRLSRCLELALRSMGGRILSGLRVEAIEADDGRVARVRGRARDGRPFEIASGTVVLAAGAWSTESIRLPGEGPELRPVKGQLVRLRGPRLLEHVVRTPDVYLVPRADGELLVGATVEEVGFDTSATGGAVMDLLRHAWEVLPGVYELELSEISVGLRSATADGRPAIGPSSVEGLFLAVGHGPSGVLQAPATAHYLAERILTGRTPEALLPFDPRRFAGAPRRQRSA